MCLYICTYYVKYIVNINSYMYIVIYYMCTIENEKSNKYYIRIIYNDLYTNVIY